MPSTWQLWVSNLDPNHCCHPLFDIKYLLAALEEMAFSTLPLRGCTFTPSRIFMTTSHGTLPIPSHVPTPKVVKSVSFATENSESDKVSTYSSLSSLSSKDSKILKLEGEAGRPGHGGYNLEKALNWDANRFKSLKSIKRYCDVDTSKKLQTPTALHEVHKEALTQFLELADYHGCWPVGDIIQMQLKNTSAKA
ncbi:hypothetical protein EV702DRAFT_1044485 [Suillus placidus]|uniref:Uncharacterized protein n=1 Tax=Suillus placidus TaxID=48579 RepID=A0A9P7D4B6_9AGAM|nr:hypothetical protein EV702DRAFT_1044485 [Suillus placidus]